MRKQSMYFWILLMIAVPILSSAQLSISTARCENKINPLGVGLKDFHFGWQLLSDENGNTQTAYQLVCASSARYLDSGIYDIWNSGKIPEARSVQVPYRGKLLAPAGLYFWKVRVWDRHRKPSAWSNTNHFCTGLFSRRDWAGARWIGFESMPDSQRVVPGVHYPFAARLGNKSLQRPVIPCFRKAFPVTRPIRRATLFVCGLGQYHMTINGRRVGDGFLTPGWTQYDKRCLYDCFDITGMINRGENVLGAIVGNGFYNINRERYYKFTGAFGFPKMICRLHILYQDGDSDNIVTGDDWKTAPSAITFTSIYGGEDHDARLEQEGWEKRGFDDAAWKNAQIVRPVPGRLMPETDYPVKIIDSFAVKRITQPKPGIYVYDFGQNASAIISIKIRGRKGQTVKFIPSELIDSAGLSNQRAISEGMGGYCYFTYTLKGDGEETWIPAFTYYGFRYIQVEGASPAAESSSDDLPALLELKSMHCRNSTPTQGRFECSNDLFNKIFTLIDWAIKSNLQSTITDCPHREKLGWLEQDYLMGTSINYNYDIYHLYRKIIYDMMDAQTKDGLVPDIAPEYVRFENGFRDSPEWGSASVILPWLVYHWYGDAEIVKAAYPMMQRYVAYLRNKSVNAILDYGLGDWYDYGPHAPGEAQLTPRALTATAIYYYDVLLMSRMAALLRHPEQANDYRRLSTTIKTAFNKKFLNTPAMVYSTGSQTAMAMPWCVGLVDEQNKKAVLNNLIDSIRAGGNSLTAGDIGFHFLVQALDEGGASQLIYEMNNRSDVPGYGLQLKKGATALTESWNALEASSNNHLMLGHIMEWFYSGIGGISQNPASTAFQSLIIRPEAVGDIRNASTSFDSPYGRVTTHWTKGLENFILDVSLPVNTSAQIYLPQMGKSMVLQNAVPLRKTSYRVIGESVCIPVPSGTYHFEIK